MLMLMNCLCDDSTQRQLLDSGPLCALCRTSTLVDTGSAPKNLQSKAHIQESLPIQEGA